jgi:hypothetical protein
MEEKLTKETTSENLENPATYTIKGKVFIVEPVFKTDGKETIGDVLMRLMKSDITES